MFARLLLLLILLPVIEIVLLVWIAMKTSVLLVLGLLLAAGVLGTLLARHQGVRTFSRIAEEMRAGRMPAESLVDAVLVTLAAGLLILPGFISDVVAILLLLPPTRAVLKRFVRNRIQTRIVTHGYESFSGAYGGRDEIIDVQVVDSPPPRLGS